MTRLLYIVSDIDKALAFEWTADRLRTQFDLSFILIGKKNTSLEKYLKSLAVPCYVVSDDDYPGHIKKWVCVTKRLLELQPDIVHTHLWRATLYGISASWLIRVKRRVFTRHHATLHYDQYPSGRKWDWLCNFLATDIVAVSESIKRILVDWDKAKAQKIHIIHHGFQLGAFDNVATDRTALICQKYRIKNYPVVGVISRYTSWKGIQFIIPAFIRLKREFPDALLVLANARGDYQPEITALLRSVPADSYREIVFEHDLPALYNVFDVFIHTPIDPFVEAFGQTYVEALASGVPSVFTLSGIAPEFIRQEYNALVVPFQNSDQIAESVKRLLEDHALRKRLIDNGRESVQQFSLNQMLTKLDALYNAS